MKSLIGVLTGPSGTFFAFLSQDTGSPGPTSKLGADLEGIHAFLNHASRTYAADEDRKSPDPTAIMTRSTCTFGQLVTITQLLQHCGMGPAFVGIDDSIPDLDFEIKMDKRVQIPAPAHQSQEITRQGWIIINVDGQGTVSAEDETILASDEAIAAYIRKKRPHSTRIPPRQKLNFAATRTPSSSCHDASFESPQERT